jgi:hypothetical protein
LNWTRQVVTVVVDIHLDHCNEIIDQYRYKVIASLSKDQYIKHEDKTQCCIYIDR